MSTQKPEHILPYSIRLLAIKQLHAKHKNFLVNLHIRKENENTNAKDFICKQERIQVGLS